MKNKKAVAVNFLIMLLIGMFVFVVMVVFVPKLIGKGSAEASQGLKDTKDYDGDGVVNAFDKCKCTSANTDNGCPAGTDPNEAGFCQYKGCSGEDVPTWAKKEGCP